MKKNYPLAILELREKLNISQHELADILGVSYPSVSRWENGHFEPTKLVQLRLDRLLQENKILLKDMDGDNNE